jgi:glucose/mannose transport system permease protein
VTAALQNLSGILSMGWNVVMAGAVVAAILTALVYLLLGSGSSGGLPPALGEVRYRNS